MFHTFQGWMFFLDFDNCEMFAEDVAQFYSNFY